ncbi:310_t:CDS:1 [Acaulospora morrowiae]|uniref:310_t:CDS:1 n=1 Tax=Acaulospora morrowiae TaxID=94023 RepID=A0A9N9N882_9GLOM|nr:310_t:CDS:1 [Acaulospora morrowiae]
MIPRLWKNPFRLTSNFHSEKLISVYLRFLPEEAKASLQMMPINLELQSNLNFQRDSASSLLIQSNSSPSQSNSTLTASTQITFNYFNYPKFLRELDVDELYYAVRKWCFCNDNIPVLSKTLLSYQCERQILLILQELFKLFMRSSERFDYLSLDIKTVEPLGRDDIIGYISLPGFPEENGCLRQLKKFISRGYYEKHQIFNSMALYCKNIQELTVEDNDSTNGDSLVDLIAVQRNLRKFTIADWWGCLLKIVQALTTQIDTLVYVEIYCCHFYELVDDSRTFEGLSLCVNLETLKIEKCHNITGEIMQPLAIATFSKLRTFHFSTFIYPDDIDSPCLELSAMIQNTKGRLENLSLDMDLSNYPKIIKTCAKNCPNLNYFKAKILSHDEIKQLLELLENCRKLEILKINDRYETGRVGPLSLELLPYMGHLIPPTLKYLKIYEWTCTPRELEAFLNSCKARLKKMSFMCLENSKSYYLEIIKEYARNNNRVVKGYKKTEEWDVSFKLSIEFYD